MKYLSLLGGCCLLIAGIVGSWGCRSSQQPVSQRSTAAKTSKTIKKQSEIRKIAQTTTAGSKTKASKKKALKKAPPLRLVKAHPPVLRRSAPRLPVLQVVPWHKLPPHLRKGTLHAPILRPVFRAPMSKSARFGGVVAGKKKPRVPKAAKGQAICRVYLHITGMT
jgi:hypothetical protein